MGDSYWEAPRTASNQYSSFPWPGDEAQIVAVTAGDVFQHGERPLPTWGTLLSNMGDVAHQWARTSLRGAQKADRSTCANEGRSQNFTCWPICSCLLVGVHGTTFFERFFRVPPLESELRFPRFAPLTLLLAPLTMKSVRCPMLWWSE